MRQRVRFIRCEPSPVGQESLGTGGSGKKSPAWWVGPTVRIREPPKLRHWQGKTSRRRSDHMRAARRVSRKEWAPRLLDEWVDASQTALPNCLPHRGVVPSPVSGLPESVQELHEARPVRGVECETENWLELHREIAQGGIRHDSKPRSASLSKSRTTTSQETVSHQAAPGERPQCPSGEPEPMTRRTLGTPRDHFLGSRTRVAVRLALLLDVAE